MNEEYLWDKSGEPDPELKQLEGILGTLRYQPKPLDLKPPSRNRYLPLLAIAATLLVAFIAGALWLRARNKTSPQLHNAGVESSQPKQVVPQVENNEPKDAIVANKAGRDVAPPRIRQVKHQRTPPASNMTASERQQALEAKEQLMMALRLTSEKLNLAQRKAQGAPANQIRNQHKVG